MPYRQRPPRAIVKQDGNVLPSNYEIRKRIESVGRDVHPTEDYMVPKRIDEYQLQMALKYQYLVSGWPSEVSGKYMPNDNFMYLDEIEETEVILFPVKIAQKKTESSWGYRCPAIPLDKKYEPWSEELLEYLQDKRSPFQFAKKQRTSSSIYQDAFNYVFKDLVWLIKRFNELDCKWTNFTPGCLRRARILLLSTYYNLNPYDMMFYNGGEEIFLSENQIPFNLEFFKSRATNYLPNLCTPFENLKDLQFSEDDIRNSRDMVYEKWAGPKNHKRKELRINGKWIKRSRIILEEKIGRPLTNDEVAHHINEDPSDDRSENLELMTNSSHLTHHASDRFSNDFLIRGSDGRWARKNVLKGESKEK